MSVEFGASVIVPSFGSEFRCRPLLHRVPRVGSPASSLLRRHSDFPLPHLAHASRFARRFRLSTEDAGSPKFLGDHLPPVPRSSIPAEPTRAGLRGFAPTSCSLGVVFRAFRLVDLRDFPNFGTRFRGPRARCLRFVSVVTFRSRKTRFRLTALSWPGGLQPAGSLTWFLSVVAYMTHLQDEACLAHRTGNGRWIGCAGEGRRRVGSLESSDRYPRTRRAERASPVLAHILGTVVSTAASRLVPARF